ILINFLLGKPDWPRLAGAGAIWTATYLAWHFTQNAYIAYLANASTHALYNLLFGSGTKAGKPLTVGEDGFGIKPSETGDENILIPTEKNPLITSAGGLLVRPDAVDNRRIIPVTDAAIVALINGKDAAGIGRAVDLLDKLERAAIVLPAQKESKKTETEVVRASAEESARYGVSGETKLGTEFANKNGVLIASMGAEQLPLLMNRYLESVRMEDERGERGRGRVNDEYADYALQKGADSEYRLLWDMIFGKEFNAKKFSKRYNNLGGNSKRRMAVSARRAAGFVYSNMINGVLKGDDRAGEVRDATQKAFTRFIIRADASGADKLAKELRYQLLEILSARVNLAVAGYTDYLKALNTSDAEHPGARIAAFREIYFKDFVPEFRSLVRILGRSREWDEAAKSKLLEIAEKVIVFEECAGELRWISGVFEGEGDKRLKERYDLISPLLGETKFEPIPGITRKFGIELEMNADEEEDYLIDNGKQKSWNGLKIFFKKLGADYNASMHIHCDRGAYESEITAEQKRNLYTIALFLDGYLCAINTHNGEEIGGRQLILPYLFVVTENHMDAKVFYHHNIINFSRDHNTIESRFLMTPVRALPLNNRARAQYIRDALTVSDGLTRAIMEGGVTGLEDVVLPVFASGYEQRIDFSNLDRALKAVFGENRAAILSFKRLLLYSGRNAIPIDESDMRSRKTIENEVKSYYFLRGKLGVYKRLASGGRRHIWDGVVEEKHAKRVKEMLGRISAVGRQKDKVTDIIKGLNTETKLEISEGLEALNERAVNMDGKNKFYEAWEKGNLSLEKLPDMLNRKKTQQFYIALYKAIERIIITKDERGEDVAKLLDMLFDAVRKEEKDRSFGSAAIVTVGNVLSAKVERGEDISKWLNMLLNLAREEGRERNRNFAETAWNAIGDVISIKAERGEDVSEILKLLGNKDTNNATIILEARVGMLSCIRKIITRAGTRTEDVSEGINILRDLYEDKFLSNDLRGMAIVNIGVSMSERAELGKDVSEGVNILFNLPGDIMLPVELRATALRTIGNFAGGAVNKEIVNKALILMEDIFKDKTGPGLLRRTSIKVLGEVLSENAAQTGHVNRWLDVLARAVRDKDLAFIDSLVLIQNIGTAISAKGLEDKDIYEGLRVLEGLAREEKISEELRETAMDKIRDVVSLEATRNKDVSEGIKVLERLVTGEGVTGNIRWNAHGVLGRVELIQSEFAERKQNGQDSKSGGGGEIIIEILANIDPSTYKNTGGIKPAEPPRANEINNGTHLTLESTYKIGKWYFKNFRKSNPQYKEMLSNEPQMKRWVELKFAPFWLPDIVLHTLQILINFLL
ncbi:MAG TPA: hypothetical protein DEE98_09210, partial [Elusimicrobia bacterium]|nr:hypothetical protein [Elusimicrobiota bacterium]